MMNRTAKPLPCSACLPVFWWEVPFAALPQNPQLQQL